MRPATRLNIMSSRPIVVQTTTFNENSGGSIVLHYLVILFLILKKRELFDFNNIFINRFFKIIFSSILMGLFFNFVINYFNEQLSFDKPLKSLYLVLSVFLGLCFYLFVSYLIKAFQLEDIKLKY